MKKKIQARLKAIGERCAALIATADKENEGVMTEEAQAEFDQLMAEAEEKKAALANIDQLDGLNADLSDGTGRTTAAGNPGEANQRIEDLGPNSQHDDTRGFANIGEFAVAVHGASIRGGSVDERLILGAPTNYHQESGTAEGFTVPPAFRSEVWDGVFSEDEDINLLNMIDSEPTESNAVDFNKDESTPWGATGIQAYWENEANQFTASQEDLDPVTVRLNKLFAFVTATEELLEDSPRLAARLMKKAPIAIRWKANEAVINGNGVGKPLGYRSSGALVQVAKESGQAADTLNSTNIGNMYSRQLKPGRAIWLANSDVIPQLINMTIGDMPVWTPPAAGITVAPNGFILGRPLFLTEHAETLGDAGDLQFVDPMGYYGLNKRSGLKFASSMHLYFDYDMQAFRWTFRLGGRPFLSAPVAKANGSNTKSHFVELAERA